MKTYRGVNDLIESGFDDARSVEGTDGHEILESGASKLSLLEKSSGVWQVV